MITRMSSTGFRHTGSSSITTLCVTVSRPKISTSSSSACTMPMSSSQFASGCVSRRSCSTACRGCVSSRWLAAQHQPRSRRLHEAWHCGHARQEQFAGRSGRTHDRTHRRIAPQRPARSGADEARRMAVYVIPSSARQRAGHFRSRHHRLPCCRRGPRSRHAGLGPRSRRICEARGFGRLFGRRDRKPICLRNPTCSRFTCA